MNLIQNMLTNVCMANYKPDEGFEKATISLGRLHFAMLSAASSSDLGSQSFYHFGDVIWPQSFPDVKRRKNV